MNAKIFKTVTKSGRQYIAVSLDGDSNTDFFIACVVREDREEWQDEILPDSIELKAITNDEYLHETEEDGGVVAQSEIKAALRFTEIPIL